MTHDGTVWHLAAFVPLDAVSAAETALDAFCPVLSTFEVSEETGEWRVEGYSEAEPDLDAVKDALNIMADAQGIAVPTVTVQKIEPRDWVAESLETFAPLSVGRYYVFGAHNDAAPPKGGIALQVDSGVAFGSGRHESTSGCLVAFDRLARRKSFARMLDMGCGSGILSLAMVKTWRADVLAVDIDPRSVQVTQDNARLNGEAVRVRAHCGAGYASGLVKRTGPYDLIVANILARPLRKMAKDAVRNLALGGHLVLAGFLTRDWRFVYSAHQIQGLTLVDKIDTGAWTTLVLKKGR